ncbi:hypothetical protein, partial [Neorhodopirellula lusitana]|uniref:hypothetical protein n=1 Tax=Neorhodopirellula lusitana TaxID=445327 RepID=UPI0024B7D8E4
MNISRIYLCRTIVSIVPLITVISRQQTKHIRSRFGMKDWRHSFCDLLPFSVPIVVRKSGLHLAGRARPDEAKSLG